MRAQPGRVTVSLLTAAALGLSGAFLAAPTASAGTVDLAVNGTFPTNTSGWYLSTAGTLSWLSPGMARMTNATTKALTMTLNDQVNTVGRPVVGRQYSAKAQVRSSNTKSQKVTVRMQEWRLSGSTWTMLGQASQVVTLSSTAWRDVAVDYTARATDSTIDVNVIASSAPAKATVDVDNIAVTTVEPDPNQLPVAGFSAEASDLAVSVDGSASSDADGSVVSYAWDFGDGSTGSGRTAQHSYAAAGTYDVRLTVTDDKGATGTATKQVTVTKPNEVPVAGFSAQASDLAVSVDGSASSDADGSVVSYAWDFGDGSTGSGLTAQHSYAAAGTYDVRLTVTDDKGATGTATKQVTVTKPAITPPAGWKLHWSDEFEADVLDTGRWTAYHNTYGDGNAELACLTPNNLSQAAGSLTISSKKETVTCPSGSTRQYTSGFIGSRESGRYYPLYGRYEIRARIPHGQGLWPAFWLRHRSGSSVAEVDVMEYFFSQVPGKTTQTLHFPSTVGRNVAKRSTFTETPVRGTGGWHTWAVEIEPVTGSDGSKDVRFRFFIDNVQTLEYVNPSPEAWNGVDPNAAWDIAVNTAVGGNYTGHPEQQLGWLPGPKVCSLTYKAPTNGDPALCPTTGLWFAEMPGRYEVDYVRVFTR